MLPIGLGEVDPDTGAPLNPHFKRKAIWATGIAAVLWLGFYFAIGFGWLEL
jgi:predicted secreted protein